MAPAKTRKSCIVSIGGYPLSAGLYGEGRKKSIRNEVATCVHRLAEADEYFPMARSCGDRNAVGAIPNLRYKIKSGLQRGRPLENTRMCYNPEEPGQCKVRQTIPGVAVHNAL